MSDPAYTRDVMRDTRNLHAHTSICEEKKKLDVCPFCNDNACKYLTEKCPTYMAKDVIERHKMVIRNRLCFACLSPTDIHRQKTCKQQKSCTICKKSHPTSLHKAQKQDTDGTFKAAVSKSSATETISMCIVPIYVSHKDNPGK